MNTGIRIAGADLFCGIGGLTRGLEDAGIEVVAGIDLDESCEYAYTKNNRALFIPADVAEITGKDLVKLYPDGAVRLLAGCAPCQSFSQLTKKNKHKKKSDRYPLLWHFGRLVDELLPDVVTMENVPNVRFDPAFHKFLAILQHHKYHLEYSVVQCAEYGIPQNRRRFVLVAGKKCDIKLIKPSKKLATLRDTIAGLDPIPAGGSSEMDPLHRARGLSKLNLRRIRSSRPGGNWRDWDDELRVPCHRKKEGRTFRSVYGRMRWDVPASTITTQFYNFGTGRYGHPEQDRAISLREGALIQTFPKKYNLIDPKVELSFARIGRHIGNAVPVKLGRIIGKSILDSLQKNNGSS